MKIKRCGLVLILLQFCRVIYATEYLVSNSTEIYNLISTVQPGDTVTMKNGLWKDEYIVFHANGTEDLPILLRAETPGYVRIQGKSYLEFSGNWVTIDGLMFKNGYSNSGQAVIEFRSSFGRANNCRLTNTVIADYNPSSGSTDYKWVSMYGKNNRVDHCHFEGKKHSGTTFVIWLKSSTDRENYHRVDHNYFGPRSELGYNGGETIRIGTSDYSMTDSYSIVENNVFEKCSGETEIISNKSCENIYRYNTFINSEGCLTLRHGNRCYVYGNFFFGNGIGNTGGVRIIGEDHQVYNNYFEKLNGSGYKSALCITKGVQDSPLNRYFQVKRALIAFNTFVDCRYTFNLGYGSSDDQTLPPKDCTIANNAVQTSSDVVRIGDTEGTPVNFTWEGNIFYGDDLGIDDPGGIIWQNPELETSSDGLYRPSTLSPLIDAAVGDYIQFTADMDGQMRSNPFDVGCDEKSDGPIINVPLSKDEVGIDWIITGPFAVEVIAGENTLSDALSLLGTEDTLKLVTDGGIYQLGEPFIVDREYIIHAAEGLSEKPVITRSSSISESNAIFEIQGTGDLDIKGVRLDGGADTENLLTALIATSETPFSENFQVAAENCDFSAVHNNGNGSFVRFYPGTQADSVIFRNCTFSECDGVGVHVDEEVDSGNFNVSNWEIQNCTFWDIGKEAISLYASNDAPFSIGPHVSIDHCTFDNCGQSVTSFLHLKDVDNAVIRNSIFSNSSPDTAAVIIYGYAYIEYCDLFNCGPVELVNGANQYDGMLDVDPKYVNATEADFTLAYSSPVRGAGKDGEALGDLRWAGDVANSVSAENVPIAADFQLYQNYPNPFNGETRISYVITEPGKVKIQIFNLNGSSVVVLERDHTGAGHYSVNWKPEMASTGLYICRVSAGGQSRMIKMMFVK